MKLRVFHSYNYVKGKYYLRGLTVYGKNNKPIFDIKNFPEIGGIYSIWIENILSKKKFSYKSNNNSYYTKHNIKIFIDINYNKLLNYFVNNTTIPDKNIILCLLSNNNLVNNGKLLEIIKNHRYITNISSIENKSFVEIPPYNYLFNEIEFDLKNRQIRKANKRVYKKIKHLLFLSDMYYETIMYFVEYQAENNCSYLVIIDTLDEYKKWYNLGFKNIVYSENIERYNNHNYFDKILIPSSNIEILDIIKKKLKYGNCIIIRTNLYEIGINDFIKLYNIVYNTDIDYRYFTIQILSFMLETTVINKFMDRLLKSNRFKIKNNNFFVKEYKPLQIYRNFNLKQISSKNLNKLLQDKKTCRICYKELNSGNVCELGCGHLMCVLCINKLNIVKDGLFNCPFCVRKTDINKLFIKKKDLLNTKFAYHFDIRIVQLIMNIKKEIKNKHEVIQCLCSPENISYIRNILDIFAYKNIGVSLLENYSIPKINNSIALFVMGNKSRLNVNECFKNYINKLIMYYIDI
jgi:hypothetical protein